MFWSAQKKKNGDDLKPFERDVFDQAFAAGAQEKELTSVDGGMATALAHAGEKLYAVMASDGYFKKNPKSTVHLFAGIGVSVLVVGWVAGRPG